MLSNGSISFKAHFKLIFYISRFKDGKPYPWPNDVSSLILYPEAENQTIYTRSASFADVGNYTCMLRNDTHKSEHHVALNVQGKLIQDLFIFNKI